MAQYTPSLNHLEQSGIKVFYIDSGSIRDKKALLRNLAETMNFPDYFGMNFNALVDCLGDLSWNLAKGYVLVLRSATSFFASNPELFTTFVDIVTQSSKEWAGRGIPFHLIIESDTMGREIANRLSEDLICIHEVKV